MGTDSSASALRRRTGWGTAGGIAAAFASFAAMGQQAPSSAAGGDLQEIVVTGSLIKRTDIETPAPVQILTSENIRDMGYTNISQVLSNLAANGQGTLNQAFSGAFASGGSGVALRGLTVGGTLTLIDSNRMVSFPISDDNQRSFVDVSAIPINAVDRVEVLKDGASATYGADAIAGVVNIILKKTYVGGEFAAEAGTSEKHDGTTEHASGIWGIGDLDTDGYNAYAAIDLHHSDLILATSRNAGYTNLDFTSLTGPGGLNTTPGAYGDPFVAYPASTTGYLFNPQTPDQNGNYANGLPAQTFLPGCSAAAQQLQQCTYRQKGLQLAPGTGQSNFLVKFTKALAGDFTTSATLSLFNTRAEQVGNYNTTSYASGGVQALAVAPGKLPVVISTPVYTVPANYPGNPYGAAAPLVYNFPEIGDTDVLVNINMYRFIWDLKGSVAGVDIDGSLGAMYSNMQLKELGVLETAAVQPALNSGYIIGPNASPIAASQLAPELLSHPTSTLYTADLHASKSLFDLPGGPFAVAAGAQFFHKVLNDLPPSAVSQGLVENGNPAFALGSQNDSAAFAEFNAQVLKSLEADGAVRYDEYNNGVGGSTTPQFKLKWKPIDMLALRGTWGKGFRAPSIAESSQSGSFFYAGTTNDPVLCPNPGTPNAKGNFPSQCQFGVTGFQQAGSGLKPVKSTSETLGFIFEPTRAFSVTVDWYYIKLTNDIISLLEAGGIGAYTGLVRAAPATLPYCNVAGGCTAAQLTNEVTPVGLIGFGIFPYVNAGETKTEGFDIGLKSDFEIGNAGKISVELNYTHEIEYNVTFGGETYQLAGTHGPSGISGDTGNPKDRAVLTTTWTKGPAKVSGTINYTGHFSITDPSAGIPDCASAITYDGRFQGGSPIPSYLCSVRTWVAANLYASWALSDSLTVHGSVDNLFNRQPPIDYQTYGGGGGYAYDASLHEEGAIGRFYMVGAAYRFK